MENKIALIDFREIEPPIRLKQSETLEKMISAHGPENLNSSLLKRYAVKDAQIAHRSLENISLPAEGADILARTQFFAERSKAVLDEFYQGIAVAPTHLIHVTCTGYVSPSAAQNLVTKKSWNEQTAVTHAYHMGCYASLPSVRIAQGLVAAGDKKVDIVHTEMCALHMDRNDHSPEQMVVQSLFADGHIKYSAIKAKEATQGIRVIRIKEMIVPNSENDMTWITAGFGMKITLSREVPHRVADHLQNFFNNLCTESGLDPKIVLTEALFAVHPGGPKIIDSVRDILGLTEDQVSASRKILLSRGNMSSATLPHVWNSLLKTSYSPGRKIVSFAFGPGLTIFGAVFEFI